MEKESTAVQLVTIRQAAGLDAARWTDERITLVWNMAAPAAKSLVQVSAFLAVCSRYDLDPLMGEVWLGELNGKPTVITGRDSYIKTAQKDPEYRGIDSGVVREGDEFAIVKRGESVEVHHTMGIEPGDILLSYCVAYHATRRPVVIRRRWEDYRHLQSRKTWKENPDDMIETRAITAALRRQYNIAGVYTESDGGTAAGESETPAAATTGLQERIKAAAAKAEAAPVAEEVPEAEYTVEDDTEEELGNLRSAYFARLRELGITDDADRRILQERVTGKASAAEFGADEFRRLLAELEEMPDDEPLLVVESDEAAP